MCTHDSSFVSHPFLRRLNPHAHGAPKVNTNSPTKTGERKGIPLLHGAVNVRQRDAARCHSPPRLDCIILAPPPLVPKQLCVPWRVTCIPATSTARVAYGLSPCTTIVSQEHEEDKEEDGAQAAADVVSGEQRLQQASCESKDQQVPQGRVDCIELERPKVDHKGGH